MERVRAGRYSSDLSLICYAASCGATCGVLTSRLASFLAGQRRCSDYVGFYDQDSLCVLLPDTDLKGALVFALRTAETFSEDGLHVPFAVYTFPQRWFTSEDGIALSARGNGAQPAEVDLIPVSRGAGTTRIWEPARAAKAVGANG